MKECGFCPTEAEARDIEEMMEYVGLSRASDYVRRAVKQMVRRDKAARARTERPVSTPSA